MSKILFIEEKVETIKTASHLLEHVGSNGLSMADETLIMKGIKGEYRELIQLDSLEAKHSDCAPSPSHNNRSHHHNNTVKRFTPPLNAPGAHSKFITHNSLINETHLEKRKETRADSKSPSMKKSRIRPRYSKRGNDLLKIAVGMTILLVICMGLFIVSLSEIGNMEIVTETNSSMSMSVLADRIFVCSVPIALCMLFHVAVTIKKCQTQLAGQRSNRR